jgi:hypothetical protein
VEPGLSSPAAFRRWQARSPGLLAHWLDLHTDYSTTPLKSQISGIFAAKVRFIFLIFQHFHDTRTGPAAYGGHSIWQL